MILYYTLDEHGEPIPLEGDDAVEQWAAIFEQDRQVAFDTVGLYDVSTVFLGLDHSIGIGPPLVFETMIFRRVVKRYRLMNQDFAFFPSLPYQERYSTRGQALEGHNRAVAWLNARQAERMPY